MIVHEPSNPHALLLGVQVTPQQAWSLASSSAPYIASYLLGGGSAWGAIRYLVYPRLQIRLNLEVGRYQTNAPIAGLAEGGVAPTYGGMAALWLNVVNYPWFRSEGSPGVSAQWVEGGLHYDLVPKDAHNEELVFNRVTVLGPNTLRDSPPPTGSLVPGFHGPTFVRFPKGGAAQFLLGRCREGDPSARIDTVGSVRSLKIGEWRDFKVRVSTQRVRTETPAREDTRHYRVRFDSWDRVTLQWEKRGRWRTLIPTPGLPTPPHWKRWQRPD